MEDTQIEKNDVENILANYKGNLLFSEALERVNHTDLVKIINKYVHFNCFFGAGVANLASQFACQKDLFRDKDESLLYGDRSMEVGACIFSAAIDEFGDRGIESKPTHRLLAQAFLKGLNNYYNINYLEFHINEEISKKVKDGYGIEIPYSENQLFKSLGFHIGSELLADKEFRTLYEKLRKNHPELVNYLKITNVEISGQKMPAYYWVKIHTGVGIEHFEYAVRGAGLAFKYYSGSKIDAKNNILEGINSFATFQEDFMKTLLD